ncbi:hypothetical protein FDH57_gp63 [Arthrobacter phage Glenn]|uniref:Uncharacterized protein n=1 Tax=Arthrobacter phage Glenn TaxID=1772297 RepID=A0A0U4IL27_9CAUD|nr:hypothetical protein FDH57_gp63 [Arthrobacter phage Glenn]ALY08975.1 hypothetical protein GLENN_63 [Arthrobacter phage Glenn]
MMVEDKTGFFVLAFFVIICLAVWVHSHWPRH